MTDLGLDVDTLLPPDRCVFTLLCPALLQVFIGHSELIQQAEFSPDQQHVITAGDAIFIWDFEAAPDAPHVRWISLLYVICCFYSLPGIGFTSAV